MFRLLVNLSWMLLVAPVAMGWQLEVGEETLNFNSYNNVTFQQAFPLGVTPVVVALTPGDRADPNDEPAVIRIRNVTNTGFEMAIVEPPGSDGRYVTQNETAQYLAVEPGVHEFPNGDIIEAATISTAAVQHGSGVPGAESWVTQPLAGGFPTPPVIVGMPQTTNNEQNPNAPGNNQQSFPFVTMAIRNVNAGNFQLANERSEVNDQPLFFIFQAETLGYIAMENGAGGTFLDNVANTIAYESFRSGDNVRGWDNGCYARPTANFLNTYNAPPAAFASKNRHDGGDGGWVRRCSISTTQVGVTVDEDRDRDSERRHTGEDIGVLIFGEPFVAIIEPLPEALLRKTVMVDSDPINLTNNPLAIPEAEVLYTIRVENLGDGVASNVQLDDPVPSNMDLYVNSTENCGSVDFRQGTPSSGLNCLAVNVSYDDGSGNYTYVPTPDASGFDAAVTDIRINFIGDLAANGATGVPSFELDLRMRLR